MDVFELQTRLQSAGCYAGKIDGVAGAVTRQGVIDFMTLGPDYKLEDTDFDVAAGALGVPVSYVKALYEVESSGSPFIDGRPAILFEPHRFSRATGGRFDASHPHISYPAWDPKRYPRTQAARYDQLAEAVCLAPDAGFASASYGGFQILGENYHRCEARDPMAFAWQESQTTADQLHHFVLFIQSDRVLWDALKRADWVTVAKRYNGTAYYKNRYDVRLAQAERGAR
ncbi:N-acetylmuramidase domain-containing protein [Sphingomonas jaspsi]|uniref:N-acetylmuramidase domain-containing protein n=1 Tax=Sphingomonas jaspsi TaxID=392409 RepID=UPI0004B73D61|nr:N-acetylmuramidase domain-containing protein [Sphingomonas jaspsi]